MAESYEGGLTINDPRFMFQAWRLGTEVSP